MAARQFPVEAGHVLAFTRALGAADPPGGLGEATPPTFAIASAQFDPGYPLRPRAGAPWHGSGADAGLVGTESLLRFGVRFATQVWPGDTLTVRSSVVRITGPVAEFSVSTVNAEGAEVMSGYAHARLVT